MKQFFFAYSIIFFFSFSDEPGVFIGKIIPNNPFRAYLGYVDQKASEKKIVRDVFTKGDSAFISGINLFGFKFILIKFYNVYDIFSNFFIAIFLFKYNKYCKQLI